MAESKSLDLGRQPLVSQQEDAEDPALVEGTSRTELRGNRYGDLEERRETQEVLVPTSDGMGEGLTKDRS